jgi:outer membrane protein OmpA-like peptidoglycan-associated protein
MTFETDDIERDDIEKESRGGDSSEGSGNVERSSAYRDSEKSGDKSQDDGGGQVEQKRETNDDIERQKESEKHKCHGNIDESSTYRQKGADQPKEKFEFNSDKITPEGKEQVRDELFSKMEEQGSFNPDEIDKVTITGHASPEGSKEYNQALSERRAEAVKEYLVDEVGIDPDKIDIVGEGEQRAISDGVKDGQDDYRYRTADIEVKATPRERGICDVPKVDTIRREFEPKGVDKPQEKAPRGGVYDHDIGQSREATLQEEKERQLEDRIAEIDEKIEADPYVAFADICDAFAETATADEYEHKINYRYTPEIRKKIGKFKDLKEINVSPKKSEKEKEVAENVVKKLFQDFGDKLIGKVVGGPLMTGKAVLEAVLSIKAHFKFEGWRNRADEGAQAELREYASTHIIKKFAVGLEKMNRNFWGAKERIYFRLLQIYKEGKKRKAQYNSERDKLYEEKRKLSGCR